MIKKIFKTMTVLTCLTYLNINGLPNILHMASIISKRKNSDLKTIKANQENQAKQIENNKKADNN